MAQRELQAERNPGVEIAGPGAAFRPWPWPAASLATALTAGGLQVGRKEEPESSLRYCLGSGLQPGNQVPSSWQPSDLGGQEAATVFLSAETWFQAPDLISALFTFSFSWLKGGNNILPSFLGDYEGQMSQCIQKYFCKGEALYKHG